MRALLILTLLLLPALALGGSVVPREQIIASPQGGWYVIVQPGGEFDIIKRFPDAPPMRSREGKAPITDAQLRLGATAEELKRSTGAMPGLRPDPGDAVYGGARLRQDPLDRAHVFEDGSGLVARYASGPTQFEGIEPIREADGSDVALVAVERATIGPERTEARFVHLYTLKDATFWGDAARDLVVMVAGGANVVLTKNKGATILNRGRGRRPKMLAWSIGQGTVVPPPIESLFEQMSSLQSRPGLTALLLAREMEPRRVIEPLKALVRDRELPHVTRLHAAATLRASGHLHGNRTILATAHGLDRATPEEQPIALADGVPADADPLREFAIRILPVSHGDGSIDDLVRLATGDDERLAEVAEAALREGPWPTGSRYLELMAGLARDRGRDTATRGLAARMLVASSDPRIGDLLTWLAGEPEEAVSGPVLEVYGDRVDDAPLVAKIGKALTKADLEPASLAAGVAVLADRAWRSAPARDALLAVLPDAAADGDDDDSAFEPVSDAVVAVLGALWRVDDARVPDALAAWSTHPDPRAAEAAGHSQSIRAWQARVGK